jgi:hypothetical protein
MRRTLAELTLAAITVVSVVVGIMQDPEDGIVEAALLVGQDTATPVPIAAKDGDYLYDIPPDQPLAVEVIETRHNREGSEVVYILFVRDGAGFQKLGPFFFDASTGVFANSEVDSELFLAPEAE